jgi:bla regulator protein blaR1
MRIAEFSKSSRVTIALIVSAEPRPRERLAFVMLALSVAVGPISFVLLQTQTLAGQDLHATGPLPSFEVASIRQDHSGSGWDSMEYAGRGAPMDRFIMRNMTIKELICMAFAGKGCEMLRDVEVAGGPGWINSDRYDIDAKLQDSDVAALYKLPNDSDRRAQVRLMMQSLLTDRFKLVVNHTTATRPVYALVLAKGGTKLHETVPGSPSPIELQGHPVDFLEEPTEMRAHGVSISTFVNALSLERAVGRPVLDQTGLKGKYDFDLTWAAIPEMSPGPSSGAETVPPQETFGPSIFRAIQEQLGLKLEPTRGPGEAIEIVHIEKPSEN